MSGRTPPDWLMPEGVNAALWHYAHSPRLAEDEDEYFRDHPLMAADSRLLAERFTEPGRLIDLGCGAGRLSLEFARRGFRVTAVDLSMPMLARVRSKAAEEALPIDAVRANLCRLGCLREGGFDLAIAMFSTFGMIRGAGPRRRAVAQAARLLKPGGRIALHAHNVWLNLGDPQGRRWLLGDAWRRWRGDPSAGDRRMTYRGVPGLEVHLYRWGELRDDLRLAGLRIDEVIGLHAATARPVSPSRWSPLHREGGWIVFARRA